MGRREIFAMRGGMEQVNRGKHTAMESEEPVASMHYTQNIRMLAPPWGQVCHTYVQWYNKQGGVGRGGGGVGRWNVVRWVGVGYWPQFGQNQAMYD